MQGRVSPDGHVGPTEVVVDRAHHTDNVEVGARLGLLRGDTRCERTIRSMSFTVRCCMKDLITRHQFYEYVWVLFYKYSGLTVVLIS